ncbi:sulfate transporter family-domain-containing protein [Chytriomyces cf. hyalinus JEL632]|nr:sulfate transporter family-domain-containing protein [Chytriomyces cf. hyalinus JEL632]
MSRPNRDSGGPAVSSKLALLVPVLAWLPQYKSIDWLYADFWSGVTVGLVLIPQAIAYTTKLARLPAELGLYSSFMGVIVYSVFATSKDVSIGPTSVLSLIVGQLIASSSSATDPLESAKLAATLAFWSGLVQLGMGFLQLGLMADFVPVPVIAGLTSGAGIQIIVGQTATLLGIKGIDNMDAPLWVLIKVINSFNQISGYDAMFGIVSLILIFALKFGCAFGAPKLPWLTQLGHLRNTIAIAVFTFISFLLRSFPNIEFETVSKVPFGLSGIAVPHFSQLALTSEVLKALPGILVVSLLEHIAVAKSYGRFNGYTPDVDQEIVALGFCNVFASLVGGFSVTASFSRSAISSSTGSMSPLASFFAGIIVIVSLFSITRAISYIPSATLAAIVIAAISELLSNFSVVKSLYEVELMDFVGFWVACIVTFIASIEAAIYASVSFSLVVLLVRIARPEIKVLARTRSGTWIDPEAEGYDEGDDVVVEAPAGILLFRPEESLTYPNGSYLTKRITSIVKERYKFGGSNEQAKWTDVAAINRDEEQNALFSKQLPVLRAIVLDFSAVNHIDYTGLQTLLDIKDDVARHAGHKVPLHFAHVRRRHMKVLLRVPGCTSASSIDATPCAPGFPTTSSSSSTRTLGVAPEPLNIEPGALLRPVSSDESGSLIHFQAFDVPASLIQNKPPCGCNNVDFFHRSVDLAVEAADAQTRDAVRGLTPADILLRS